MIKNDQKWGETKNEEKCGENEPKMGNKNQKWEKLTKIGKNGTKIEKI